MPTLMIQGTTSDAGKSTLVAAICRCLKRRGVSVVPFKPQNMALNSAVTADGGEIGRAQALQAQACGLEPSTDMNPILLKPSTDVGAQVIIHGKARGNMSARSYHEYKQVAIEAVLESHTRLSAQYDIVVVEGAGSPAEINLRENDIANMGFAEAVDCPVIIVADIDRGGVFAHLVGTLDLLSESEQARVKGFVINRFRGDIALLESGLDWLEERTSRPVLGVLPYLPGLHLDAEDAIISNDVSDGSAERLKVIVPVLPRISNHTDFDPLRLHPSVEMTYVALSDAADSKIVPPADLIILPGSKSVRDDLAALKAHGWDKVLNRHLRYGGKVLGVCGGYQMLGRSIADPHGIESTPGESEGFGFLDCHTVLNQDKTLKQRKGTLNLSAQRGEDDVPITGYEIHVGETSGSDCERAIVFSEAGDDGALSEDAQVAGTYWHGLFDQPDALAHCLVWAGLKSEECIDLNAIREEQLDRLADALEEHLDMDALIKISGLNQEQLESNLVKQGSMEGTMR